MADPRTEPVIALRDVVMEYGETVRTRVLHGLDLAVAAGEFSAIIGPSGSGKSTLLNLVGLLERPTSGSIRVAGEEATTLSDDDRARLRNRTLGFVFQFHHLLPAFTALENVTMPLLIRKGRREREAEERGQALLDLVGLGQLAHRKGNQLSGGQQQRVAIARALASEPRVLLADEPTGNLDTESADAVFDLFRRINEERGMAVVVVTHDPRLADRCDRVVRIVDGRIVEDTRGPPGGPCRVCGYGPCVRGQCIRAEDIPGVRAGDGGPP